MFFQLSLVAAFVAGIVALFAPCCITFLLPTYFANIFKEKNRVVLMTVIYSLGIFTIMMPVVLGMRILTDTFFNLHDQTYVIGGLFLIVVGFSSLLGFKLPMPRFSFDQKANDPLSTYLLGVIAGITTACCAPVLIGVITLSSLSPNTIQSLLVGFFYVLGMVTPLYIASLFIDKGNLLERPMLRRPVREITLGNKVQVITVANLIAFTMFVGMGLVTIFLALSGQLAMNRDEASFAPLIQSVAAAITAMVKNIPGIDLVFLVVVGWLLYRLIKYLCRQ